MNLTVTYEWRNGDSFYNIAESLVVANNVSGCCEKEISILMKKIEALNNNQKYALGDSFLVPFY